MQDILGASSEAIKTHGLLYFGPHMIRRLPEWGQTWEYYVGRSDKLPAMSLPVKHGCAILSEESLSHHLMPNHAALGGFNNIDRTADIIEAIPARRRTVVLTIRRQDGFIRSCFTHAVHRHCEQRDFRSWLDRFVDVDRFSWLRIINRLEGRFGGGNVVVRPMEALRDMTSVEFVRRCFPDLAKADLHHPDNKSNPSLGVTGINLALRMNAVISKTVGTNFKLSESVNTALIQSLKDDEPFRESFQEEADLSRLFRDENRHIRANYFPEIGNSFEFS